MENNSLVEAASVGSDISSAAGHYTSGVANFSTSSCASIRGGFLPATRLSPRRATSESHLWISTPREFARLPLNGRDDVLRIARPVGSMRITSICDFTTSSPATLRSRSSRRLGSRSCIPIWMLRFSLDSVDDSKCTQQRLLPVLPGAGDLGPAFHNRFSSHPEHNQPEIPFTVELFIVRKRVNVIALVVLTVVKGDTALARTEIPRRGKEFELT
ncbi:hypothetical protein DL767_010457 [Monosporascus sp. MG133]|nr:hypothetical protein DL767_010457 [Monosporascus sp. MG133]